MSRSFASGSSQYLEYAGAALTAAPVSIALWFYPSALTAAMALTTISQAAALGDWFRLICFGNVANDPVGMGASAANTSSDASSTTGPNGTANTWYHAAGTSSAANQRTAYFNGSSAASNTDSRTPGSVNTTSIGRLPRNGTALYFDGRLAEVGIWNVALNANEVAALAGRVSPRHIRPESLVGYWPVWGLHSPEIDLTANNRQMTVTGATLANHAPVAPFTVWV